MKFWSIIISMLLTASAFAEGTKELMPSNTGKCYLQFNEQIGTPRDFAKSTNTDTLRRLYIHIANVGEVINLGFKKLASITGDAQFRIKDASGTIIYAFTAIPTTGAGYISTFNEASIGPNTLTGGAGGYTPLTYTTTSTGDYYIEFEKTSTTTSKYNFEYFDITVSSAANVAIPGRVWSYAWDLNTSALTNSAYSIFYIYSADKYITKININGMQPYSFIIACNSNGAQVTGDLAVDRRSRPNSNSVYPKYKIFLNTPDPAVYDVATIPTMTENLRVNGTPNVNDPVEFYVNMSKSGNLEIFLDIDGTPGYQAGGRDVALVKFIAAGGDVIIWDGNDGLGDPVVTTITVTVASKFATGVTHLPVYDAEKNPNGFLVTRIAPNGPEDLVLYWDDSQIPYGALPGGQVVTMLSGNTTADGHIWSTDGANADGFGNNHTTNTWWNGYEINNLSSFDFTLLPIKLIAWEANTINEGVQLHWTTATETNNQEFVIQRSYDGVEWDIVATMPGAGNSTQAIDYSYVDNAAQNKLCYYVLQQIDYDGSSSFSKIVSVYPTNNAMKLSMHYTQGNSFILVQNVTDSNADIQLFDSKGANQRKHIVVSNNSETELKIDISNVARGAYYLIVGDRKFSVIK